MLGLKRSEDRRADTEVVETTQPASAPQDAALFHYLVSATSCACIVTDTSGVVTQTFGDFDTITGLSGDTEVVGQHVHTLMALLDEFTLTASDGSEIPLGDESRDVVDGLLRSGATMRMEGSATRVTDGGTTQVEVFLPGDGTVLVAIRDISAIAHDRAMLQYALRTASAGYWSMDLRSGAFSFSDTVNARLSDAERARIAQNGLFAILHKDDITRMAASWQDIVSGLGEFDLTYRVVTEAEGTMWQRSIGEVQTGPDGTRIKATAFVIDITEDMKNRQDLEEAQSLARAKEDFMARMSHEIRTPLNAIIGMADSLQDEPMSDEVRGVVRDMEQAAENLHGLLSHTLDHARLSSGAVQAEFEPIDPRAVIAGCVRTWRAKCAAKGLELRTGIGADIPGSLPLDSFRLRQCLDNLLSNAVKFTDSGRIVLAARRTERAGVPHIAFIVQDSGIGMSAEQQRVIFDPYNQADGSISRRFGGTGLGLSISRQLSVLMGGRLSVRSEPGKGSAFVLALPFEPQAQVAPDASVASAPAVPAATSPTTAAPAATSPTTPAPAAAPAADEKRLPFEGLSVLCVEDNPINQKVVERLIGSRVEQLHFAGHGREALAVLNTVHVDVVLMDIHMPVMDGIETTMEIRKSDTAYANVIIIALTADPDYQQMRICRNIGMNDTIAKPVRREDILEAFNRTMGSLSATHGVRVALG